MESRSKFEGFIGQNTTIPTHDGDPYMNAFTFESYECLHEFLTSNERLKLMRNLLPLLEATSIAQISGRNSNDSMYICMYVRMYVFMYVCTYVCMYVCTYVPVGNSYVRLCLWEIFAVITSI